MTDAGRRRRFSIFLFAAVVVAMTSLSATTADAAVLINATPSVNLTATTLIDVTVTGLSPNQVVLVGQCGPVGFACDGTGNLSADGSGNLASKLVARPIVSYHIPGAPPDADCRVQSCTIRVVDASNSLLASTPVTFTAGADPTTPSASVAPMTDLQDGQAVTVSAAPGLFQPSTPNLSISECLVNGFQFPFFCSFPTSVSNPGDGSFAKQFNVTDHVFPQGLPPYDCRVYTCAIIIHAQLGSSNVAFFTSPGLSFGQPPSLHSNIAWNTVDGVDDPIAFTAPSVLQPGSSLVFEQCVTGTTVCNAAQNHTTDANGMFSGTVKLFPVTGMGTPDATICHPDASTNRCSVKVSLWTYGGPMTIWQGIGFANGPAPPVPVVPSGVPAGVGKVSVSSALPAEHPGDVTVTLTASPGGASCQFVAPFGSSTTSRSCTISGLAPGATYDVTASAAGVWGTSGSSAAGQVTTVPTGTVTGVVRNSVKRALPGMLVVATADGATIAGFGVSGADGTVSVSLPAGDYKLATIDLGQLAGHPDFYLTELYDNGGASAADLASATVVSVSAGSATALNTIVLAYNHPGSITGVVDDGTTPLGGMLSLLSLDGELKPVGLAVTAGDGTFTIGNLPPGNYKLVTIDVAYGSSSYFFPEFYDNAGSTLADFATAQPIVVTAGNDSPLNPIRLDHTP